MITEWKPVKCLECDEVEFIPKAWNQNWFMCLDCGLFREVEKQNAK
jgi:hypothetical protein